MSIKSLVSRKTKNEIKYFLSSNKHTYDAYQGKKKAIVCLGADYGNLGDVAITFAQMDFLKRIFQDREVLEFPISSTYLDMKSLEAVVAKEDIITLVGGGNTSERYADIEECRQFILKKFSRNTILAFPQSVELENASNRFIRDMQKAYSAPKRLYLMARERNSFEAYRRYLPHVSAALFPDIALSMMIPATNDPRSCITLSLRKDKEKKLSASDEETLRSVIEKRKIDIAERDTQLSDCSDFSQMARWKSLLALMEQYQKSRVVITDRLHGMLLAYITNTPCIVFACDNPKIGGCYEWLRHSDQVVFFNEFSERTFESALQSILNRAPYFNEPVDFDGLENYIRTVCG